MKSFYVTCRDAGRTGWLAGPFKTHKEALEHVKATRKAAYEVDPFSHFFAFGTASVEHTVARPLPRGVLNTQLGMDTMDLGTRAMAYGLHQQRQGHADRARVARAVLDSADARRNARCSRAWARIIRGQAENLIHPTARQRALRKIAARCPDCGATLLSPEHPGDLWDCPACAFCTN